MKRRKKKTVDLLVQKAGRMVDAGLPISQACAKVGISPTAYHLRKRRGALVPVAHTVIEAAPEMPEVSSSGRVMLLIGEPAQLRAFLGGVL